MNFWIAIDKPPNISSSGIVYKVRKILNVKKVGHGGTLDPFATGVLALAVGEATKSFNYLMSQKKTYEFEVKFGVQTDTDDIEGIVTKTSMITPSEEEIVKAIPFFVGDIMQIPPKFSAKKVSGERAYDLARNKKEFSLSPCKVSVENLKLLGYSKEKSIAKFRLVCDKGVYVRSIARDLGQLLKCYGHVVSLRRTRLGMIDESLLISLEELEENVRSGELDKNVIRISSLLSSIYSVKVSEEEAIKVKNGCNLHLDDAYQGMVRLLDEKGLIAIGEIKEKVFSPRRVFNKYLS